MSGFPRSGGSGAVASVFGRIGNVVAAGGDYTAAQVTNAADKAGAGQQLFTAEMAAPDLAAAGLTGAANQSRLVGRTAGGAPVAGTFAVGDIAVDAAGLEYVCTAAGTPGTWVQVGTPGATNNAVADADITVVNTVAKTVLATLATPTGLAAGDRLVLELAGEITNNSAAAVTYTFSVDLGATVGVIVTNAISVAQNASTRKWALRVVIAVTAVATAQRISSTVAISIATADLMPVTTSTLNGPGYGTAAIDLTTTKNVVVNVQMGTADPAANCVKHTASLGRIPKV